ncbi:MAG: transcription elongation factor GreA [Chloroflexi bacterium RBG_16_68_14]|nr:MAG: transcription elongation factor GreA [Chloroflexi bacterium RBG_16_68_14]
MAEEHGVLLTEDGLAKLVQEMEHLKHVRRPQVAERIRQSKELASTQNNAEYDDAKNDQAFVEGRILTLEKLIQDAIIIDEEEAHHASTVQIGSTVSLSEGRGKRQQQFTIVGSAEADPKQGRISNESPVGRALLGKRVGDEVHVQAPKAVLRFTITKIS